MDSKNITVIVGLRAEARIARQLGWKVEIGGGNAIGAARAVERAIARGATGLVSFGLAGGLDPSLRPGAILVARSVWLDGQDIATDPTLNARLGGGTAHRLLAGATLLDTADSKRRCWRDLQAHAIDLESAAVARAAQAHHIPFAVLRAICDPANCSLPPAALIALDHAGAIGLWRTLRAVLRHPRQIPDLLALARDAQTARLALAGRVAQIGRQ